jgi:5-dehydro-2-deoxygluconokinase
VSAKFDLVTMGRSSIDLYSQDIGAPFPEISGFAAYVGGCPTNIAVGVQRLGLKTRLLTAVGTDPVGDFVCAFLEKNAVDTGLIAKKSDRRTSAVLLGIEPPDHFPLVFYREGCADIALNIDDVPAFAAEDTRAFLITGTGLSREPSRSATMIAAERARGAGAIVVLDVDFRADQWHDSRAFGVVLRSVLPLVDLVIGTEEELTALGGAASVEILDAQVSSPVVVGDLGHAIEMVLKSGAEALVLKRGKDGATIFLPSGKIIEADPFPVEVTNVLGAGDAFASGFIYGHLSGWGWHRSARLGNAVGAIVVTRPGCADFMPFMGEVEEFMASRGGLE